MSGWSPATWLTGAGSTRDPDWFRNLRTAEVGDVQIGRGRLRVRRPRELTGAACDIMWTDTILARRPRSADTPAKLAEPSRSRSSIPSNRWTADRSHAAAEAVSPPASHHQDEVEGHSHGDQGTGAVGAS